MKNLKFFLVAAGALLLVGAGCQQYAQEQKGAEETKPAAAVETGPIKIGWVGPLTGDLAGPGQDAYKAAQIAVDEVNGAGGINGRQLEMIAEDTKCNPKDGATGGNKLINLDKVVAINGGACSGETTAVAPTAEQNKVVLVSYCSSAPNITTAGDYIFRTYPSDAFQGKVGAEYMYNKLGKKKVAVLAVLGDYGTGLKNSFIKNFTELGGQVLVAEDFTQDSRDLRSQLTKVKNSEAEALYFVGQTEAYLVGYKQMKELGIKLPVMGGDTLDDSKIHETGLAEGTIYTTGAAGVTDQKWLDEMKARGASNTACAPRSYDNIKLLADIMKRVGSDSTAIKNALYEVKDFPGIAGPITLDSNGDVALAQYDFKVVKNKKFEIIK